MLAANQDHGRDTIELPVSSTAAAIDALSQDRRRLDAVTELIGGWVWETDAVHRFIYMSATVERLAGKRPERHYGKTLADLGILSAESSERSGWLAKLDARLPFGPIDFVRFDKGQPFFMRTSGKPQFDAEGNFTGYVGVAYAIPGTSVAAPVERRGAERLPVVRAAEIVLPGDGSIIACVLVDISAAGARLRVPDGIALPETLEMHVPALGQRRQCVLRWRRDGDAGVEFCT